MTATPLRRTQQHQSRWTVEPARIAAVQHALQVLASFSAAEPLLGVSEIARRVGVHKSTVSRILATLEEARLVERDPLSGRFRLGAGIVALAGPLLANLDVRDVARPYLEQLALESAESVSLSIWNRWEAVNVDQVLGTGSIKHIAPVGRRNPAHASATGKVFLAHARPGEISETIARGLWRFTERTIVDPDHLHEELARVRRLGYAENVEELEPNLIAVAAPVRDHRGQVVAAVGISAPGFGVTRERLAEFGGLARQAAAAISQRLGYGGAARPARGEGGRG
jgi:DNA-binding IclR family transcriptional regulator